MCSDVGQRFLAPALTPLGIFTVKSAEEDPYNLPADTLVSGAKAASGIMGSVGKDGRQFLATLAAPADTFL